VHLLKSCNLDGLNDDAIDTLVFFTAAAPPLRSTADR
jgi:hypothetical protein